MKEKTHFKIIVPMYNCALWAEKCLRSIFNQDYKNWHVVVIVEPCTDNTYDIVDRFLCSTTNIRWILIHNDRKKNVPKNHIDGIAASNPNNDDVIVCLDGDDCFFDSSVLSHLNSVYENSDIWIT